MMDIQAIAPVFLATAAAGGLAYVFVYPLLSGESRAKKRQKALSGNNVSRRTERAGSSTSKRDTVAQSLKEIEARQDANSRATLEMKIGQAGLDWSKRKFYVVSFGIGLVAGFLVFLASGNLIATVTTLFVGLLGLPRWLLNFLKKRRINKFINELPNAMDVVVRGIRSGLPLADCLRIIANESAEPLKSEFRTIIESQALGITLAEGVSKLYERVPVSEANFFAIVIAIQQKAGGNLSEALGNLSRVLRERKKMKGKIKAMSMEANASAAIIAAMPFIVTILLYLSSPSYIELLWKTETGKIAMVGGAIWMSLGLLTMKKMITFDI